MHGDELAVRSSSHHLHLPALLHGQDRYLLPEWVIARLLADHPDRAGAIHATFQPYAPPPPTPDTPPRVHVIAARCAALTVRGWTP